MQQQNGNVVWFEVMGQDLEGLHRFYSELFGWKLKNDEGAPYLLTRAVDEGRVAGARQASSAGGAGGPRSGSCWPADRARPGARA